MCIFNNQKFLFLPNTNSPSLKFLAELIIDKGGEIVESFDKLDPATILLINDSFVDEQQNIIHEDILRKESDIEIDYIYDYMNESPLKCIRISQVSNWLKNDNFNISDPEPVNLPPKFHRQPLTHEKIGSSSESTTEIEETNEEDDFHNEQKEGRDIDKAMNNAMETYSMPTKEKWSKNELVAKCLKILAHRYKVKGDNFRSRSYNLARIGIKRLPQEIKSGKQAQKEVSNVGPSIARKIQVILETGTLPGIYESQFERSLGYLSKCHNVGPYTARRWTNLGLKTFSEVCQKYSNEIKSDWPILFGWSFYEDWSVPIPRQECDEIGQIVSQELKKVDPECQIEIQGSYLRGAHYCGDLDVLFYKKNCNDMSELSTTIEEVAVRLYHRGYIRCFLQLTPKISQLFAPRIHERFKRCNLNIKTVSPSKKPIKKFYLGIQIPGSKYKSLNSRSKLAPNDQFMSLNTEVNNPCRRVDFFSCKWSELGASRLQWTGPKEFNRWLRMAAIEKGMKLTQHGLFDNRENLLESFDERTIFQLMGLPYVEPEERNHVTKRRSK